MVICLERGADLHMAQLMPLPLTVSCFSKIQIGFTFLVLVHLGSPGNGPLNVCVYCDSYWQNMQSVKSVLPFCSALPIQYTRFVSIQTELTQRACTDAGVNTTTYETTHLLLHVLMHSNELLSSMCGC